MNEDSIKKLKSNELKKTFKYILGYATCVVFFIGMSVYLYMFIVDYLEKEKHTKEEQIWIYGFLVVLIIGFVISYNIIYQNT